MDVVTIQIIYPYGKDTVELVGDGKFQIEKYPDHLKLEMFINENKAQIIDGDINEYKKINDYLYVVGEDGTYTVVNGETNTCKQYSPGVGKKRKEGVTYLDSYSEFTKEEQKVFERLERWYMR